MHVFFCNIDYMPTYFQQLCGDIMHNVKFFKTEMGNNAQDAITQDFEYLPTCYFNASFCYDGPLSCSFWTDDNPNVLCHLASGDLYAVSV